MTQSQLSNSSPLNGRSSVPRSARWRVQLREHSGVLDHIEVESVPEVPDDPCSDFLIGSASDLLEMAWRL